MAFKVRDKLFTGLLMGVIFPLIFLLIVIVIKKEENSISSYLHAVYSMGILSKLYSICLIPNLLLFFGFIRLEKMLLARGILFSMFVAAFVIGILKIL